MELTVPFNIEARGRLLEFAMLLNPAFAQDAGMLWFHNNHKVPEPDLIWLLLHTLQPGDLVVDGGANIGLFTIIMSLLVGPQGKVLSIEPGPNNLPKLATNLQLNNCENVEIVAKALGAVPGTDEIFYLKRDSGFNARYSDENDAQEVHVDTTTLDALCTDRRPKLIKLDIEGSETHALQGAYKLLLRRVPYIVCETNVEALMHMGSSLDALRRLMIGSAYQMFVLHETGQIPSLVPSKTALVPTRQNANILFSTLDNVAMAWPEVNT